MNAEGLSVYLSGEIHSDWREQIETGCSKMDLDIDFLSPVTDHASSDDCGVEILGSEDNAFWKDRKGAGINAIRTRTMLERADVVVVRFGDKYKQWNTAFEAGYAASLGTPLIALHDSSFNHPLKEIDSAALATAETPEEVVRILKYVMEGSL
jgi:YtoQ family protein